MPLAEKELIEEVRRLASNRRPGRGPRSVIAGIGDDCAVLRMPAGWDTLVTTDFSLEGVHFRRDWHSAEAVGHRCVARGLSDIAAMGGDPVAVFLSLALPGDLPQSWVRGFIRGLTALTRKNGAVLAGGDTAQSPGGIMADIVVLGKVPEGSAILRSGARPGDRIFVSGALGGAATAVVNMQKCPHLKIKSDAYPRHFWPEPRLELGRWMRRKGLASSMIDTSDGLSTDLAHICEESGVGAEIKAAAIPRARVGKPAGEVELQWALHGGEDYELLFTVPRGKRVRHKIAGVAVTEIGRITRKQELLLRGSGGDVRPLVPRGWEHFRSR